MSLRSSLSVKLKFKSVVGVPVVCRILNLNSQLQLAALRAARYGWYSGTTFWIASLNTETFPPQPTAGNPNEIRTPDGVQLI